MATVLVIGVFLVSSPAGARPAGPHDVLRPTVWADPTRPLDAGGPPAWARALGPSGDGPTAPLIVQVATSSPPASPAVQQSPAPDPPPSTGPAAPDASAGPAPGYGCAAALGYLQTHAAPGYQLVCPGYAEGHEAMTCDNWASICPGQREIVISDPCPVAYMNEASNSLVFAHLSTARIDPYGDSCSG